MDRRREILRAAADEIGRAGVDEIFGFLTPARLAEGPGREWSAGTVRYQFRREGLAFDRAGLVAELTDSIVARARTRFGRWASATQGALATEPDPHGALVAAFAVLGARLGQREIGTLRLAALAGVEAEAEVEAIIADAVRRVLDAYAHALGDDAPASDALDEAAHAIAARVASGRVQPGPLTALADTVVRRAGGQVDPWRDAIAGEEHAEDAVLRLERRLDAADPASLEALRIVEELAIIGPTGDWVFGRVRARFEALLHTPRLRDSVTGQRVWIAAAEVVAMAGADRELADEAAALALSRRPLHAELMSLHAAVRTGWLLIRLDRLDEAHAQFARVRRLASRGDLAEPRALAEAFTVLIATLSGPLVDVDAYAAPAHASSLARTLAAAAHGRALLLRGHHDEAADLLFDREYDSAPASLGTSMVDLYRGWVLLARGENRAAHAVLTTVRERLWRLGARNPAGWPWLEPSVAALVGLGDVELAEQLIAVSQVTAQRWGTPLVLAEIERARALAAPSDAARRAALRRARAQLAAGPAVERERAALAAALAGGAPGDAGANGGVAASSVMVQLHAPGGGLLDGMSARVREVALLVASGVSNDEIAARLAIAPSTVARHVSAALRATDTRNRTELAALLARNATPRREL